METYLFLCTYNAARSQMAQGFFNHYNTNPDLIAKSAGLRSVFRIPESTVLLMYERGIDISHQMSTQVTMESLVGVKHIINFSEETQRWLGNVAPEYLEKVTYHNISDPQSSPEQMRIARDQIETIVKELLDMR